jgi:glycosyltransferase involved in cell wall biosynthesis
MVRSQNFDVAHVMFLNYFTDAVDLRLLVRRVPLVSTVHDVVPHKNRLPVPVVRAALGSVYRAAGHLVATHPEVRRRLVADFDVDPSRVSVVPLPVHARQEPVARVLPSDRPVRLLFFGTIRPNKGVHVLLRALHQLPAEQVELVIAGQAAEPERSMLIAAADTDRRITLELGWISPGRKDELLSQADLIVLPYTSFASQSGVLHDAYAFGVPVVASDVGALGPTVRTEGTGWTVPANDAEALAERLDQAILNGNDYARASQACVTVARERTPKATADSLAKVYRSVLG